MPHQNSKCPKRETANASVQPAQSLGDATIDGDITSIGLGILVTMLFDLRQLPDPSPPPIKEPPEGPENPDVPLREPDPDFQM
jgi:hypothetical protein